MSTRLIYAKVIPTGQETLTDSVTKARTWAESFGNAQGAPGHCRIYQVHKRPAKDGMLAEWKEGFIELVGRHGRPEGNWVKVSLDDPICYCLPEIVVQHLAAEKHARSKHANAKCSCGAHLQKATAAQLEEFQEFHATCSDG